MALGQRLSGDVHVLTTTERGEIAALRDYFGPQTAQHASRQALA